jgi:hypothetical protein
MDYYYQQHTTMTLTLSHNNQLEQMNECNYPDCAMMFGSAAEVSSTGAAAAGATTGASAIAAFTSDAAVRFGDDAAVVVFLALEVLAADFPLADDVLVPDLGCDDDLADELFDFGPALVDFLPTLVFLPTLPDFLPILPFFCYYISIA